MGSPRQRAAVAVRLVVTASATLLTFKILRGGRKRRIRRALVPEHLHRRRSTRWTAESAHATELLFQVVD